MLSNQNERIRQDIQRNRKPTTLPPKLKLKLLKLKLTIMINRHSHHSRKHNIRRRARKTPTKQRTKNFATLRETSAPSASELNNLREA
jgi:hypothetical protein